MHLPARRLGHGAKRPAFAPIVVGDAPRWLWEAYPEMFAYPSLVDRLTLYAVVLRSRELSADPRRCAEILDAAQAWARAFEPLLP